MEFIRDGATVPVPFNILPKISKLCEQLQRFTFRFEKKKKESQNQSIAVNHIEIEITPIRPNHQRSNLKQRSIDNGALTYKVGLNYLV